MRAPAADYSATRRAINSEAQLNSYSRLSDRIENTQKNLELSQASIDVARKHLDVQTGLSIAGSVVEFAETAVSLGNQIYKQNQSDLVAAKTTDVSAEASIRITEAANGTGNEIVEDDNGNLVDIKMDPALTTWFDDQIAAIEGDSTLGKAAKQTMIGNINKLRANAKVEIYNQYINNKVNALDTVEQDLLKRAVQTDIGASEENRSLYGDYAAADAYIQSNSNWSAAQKQAKAIEAHNAIDLGRAKNAVQQVALAKGYDSAVLLARDLQSQYGWAADSSEYKSLLSIAQIEDANETLRLTNAASSAMTNGLNSMATNPDLTPEAIYDQIKSAMDGQPQSRIDAAIQAAKTAHISWATGVTSKVLATVTTDTRDELLLEQAALEQMNDNGYFSGGAESIYTTAQKTVQTYIDNWNSYYGSAETASTKELAARVTNIKSAADMIVSSFTSGQVSAETAVLQMQGILGEYNIDGTYEDDLYLQKMIQSVEDNVVPAQYKDITKNWLDSFSVQVASAKGYPVNSKNTSASGILSGLDPAQRADVDTATNQAYAAVLDLFRQTAASEMTPSLLNSKLQSISEMFTADAFSALGGGVKDATFWSDSNVKKVMNAFAEHPDIVYYNSKTGKVTWVNEDFENSYNEVADWCAQDLEAKGIILEGMPKLYTDSNGIHPFPVFTTKAGTQLLYNNEGIYVLGTGEKYNPVVGPEMDPDAEANESAKAAVEELINQQKSPVIEPNFDMPPSFQKKDLPPLQKAMQEYKKAIGTDDEEPKRAALEAAVQDKISEMEKDRKNNPFFGGIDNDMVVTDEQREIVNKGMEEAKKGAAEQARKEEEAKILNDPYFPSQVRPVSLYKIINGSEFRGDVGEAVETAELISDVIPEDMAAEVSPDCSISLVSKDDVVAEMDDQWYDMSVKGLTQFYEEQIKPTVEQNAESMKDKEYNLTPAGLAGFFHDLFAGVGE